MKSIATRAVVLVGLLIALSLAGVISFYASDSPDGLNRVALDLGFAEAEQTSGTSGGPLAGYETAGVENARWSGGLAGLLGCLVVLGCSFVLFRFRKRLPDPVQIEGS